MLATLGESGFKRLALTGTGHIIQKVEVDIWLKLVRNAHYPYAAKEFPKVDISNSTLKHRNACDGLGDRDTI